MNVLPVGKLDMKFLSSLLAQYTSQGGRVKVGARIGEDAAVLDFGDRYLVTKTNPITFPTPSIGWYVVNVCVNNMVVRGVRPQWILSSILLPEKITTPELVENIFRQIYEASQKVGVEVIGGHTEVTIGLDRPIVTGHILGEIYKEDLVISGGAQMGDSVMVTKAVAIEGTSIIASEKADELRQSGFSDEFLQRAKNFLYDPGISVYTDALTAAGTGRVHAMTDATEGGLATALYEMASAAKVGLRIDAEKIPLLPETEKICAHFDIDPMGLIASGMILITVAAEHVTEIQHALGEAGILCTEIGVVIPLEEGNQLVRGKETLPLPYYSSDELTKVF